MRWQFSFIAGVVALSAILLVSQRTRQPAVADFQRTPVLLVHGHGLTSADWDSLRLYLHGMGYPPQYLYALDIRPSRMANATAAEQFVAPGVQELLSRAQQAADAAGVNRTIRRVDIVAHSMGSVSTRWYAAKLAPETVRTWISVAGANHGTNALCEHTDDGAAEMCPAFARTRKESAIQTELNGSRKALRDETPFGIGADPDDVPSVVADAARNILYFTVRIDPDDWIIPADSAVLSGTGGIPLKPPHTQSIAETSPGNYLLQQEEDHMSMLDNRDFHRLMDVLLSARDPTAAE